MKTSLYILLFSALLTSCHQKPTTVLGFSGNGSEMADLAIEEIPITRQEEVMPPAPPMPETQVESAVQQQEKKIIKDGRMGIKVANLETAKSKVDTLLLRWQGYYGNEALSNSNYQASYDLTIRIPSRYFELFITALEKGGGEVEYKSIDARDVTTQFIDLETRLTNKQSYLKRYNELLKKANTVEEILKIEEKIRRIEEEIESTTGTLKYLSSQVDYSTLRLTLTQEKEYIYEPQKRDSFMERLKMSLSKGWFAFVDFLLFMIRLWPFWILLAGIIWIWKKFRSRKKKK
ncbi:DUF4349 domain-containing protein [Carboxylicivirga caseinilyticus]|uniref:DUF4349 domain-containing protein n=1 Tax=Carboxylicivirga caseinilyticus TaxID=3417572 RepID=UPI003D33205E|nr:DUF4349 domain-containing protein [Marinilabiliaceae bacterium A049]